MIGNSKTLLILLLLPFMSVAQQKRPVLQLNCVGIPPAEMLTNELDKTKEELREKDNDLKRRDRKEFILESNFALNDLFGTGLICYGDPYTLHLESMLESIRSVNAEIPKDLHIYTTRITDPNAFAWRDGNLFVNIGLFDLLDNDAQLAFVLCHEIIHYTNEHVKEQFIYRKELETTNDSKLLGDKLSAREFQEASNFYSQQLETEADIEGLKLFLNTHYSIQEGIKALERLKSHENSSLHEDIRIYELFGFSDKLKDSVQENFTKLCREISSFINSQQDSIPQSHPALDYRIEYINKYVLEHGFAIDTGLILTPAYKQLKESCPYDVFISNYKNHNYELVFYQGWVNHQKNTEYSDFFTEYALRSFYYLMTSYDAGVKKNFVPFDSIGLAQVGYVLGVVMQMEDSKKEHHLAHFIEQITFGELEDGSYFFYCALRDLISKLESSEPKIDWYQTYLDKYISGQYVLLAKNRLK